MCPAPSCAAPTPVGPRRRELCARALSNSCNPAFIQIGTKMGAQTFYSYFNAFGLTEPTGIDLPGEAQSQYYDRRGARPGPAGQLLLRPVQQGHPDPDDHRGRHHRQRRQSGAAASGQQDPRRGRQPGREHLEPEAKRQVISEDTSREILDIMQDDKTVGRAYVQGYRVGGKSGTSQKLDSDDPDARIASFVGVAPCDDPEIAVLVILDEPQNSVDGRGLRRLSRRAGGRPDHEPGAALPRVWRRSTPPRRRPRQEVAVPQRRRARRSPTRRSLLTRDRRPAGERAAATAARCCASSRAAAPCPRAEPSPSTPRRALAEDSTVVTVPNCTGYAASPRSSRRLNGAGPEPAQGGQHQRLGQCRRDRTRDIESGQYRGGGYRGHRDLPRRQTRRWNDRRKHAQQ